MFLSILAGWCQERVLPDKDNEMYYYRVTTSPTSAVWGWNPGQEGLSERACYFVVTISKSKYIRSPEPVYKHTLYSILLKCLIRKKGLCILLPWGRWATCNLLLTLNPTFGTCRARTSDTTKQGQPTLKPNIGCDSKPRCSKAYVSFSSHQNPLNTPKKGREGQRLSCKRKPLSSRLFPQPAGHLPATHSYHSRRRAECARLCGQAGGLCSRISSLYIWAHPQSFRRSRAPPAPRSVLTASLASCSALTRA